MCVCMYVLSYLLYILCVLESTDVVSEVLPVRTILWPKQTPDGGGVTVISIIGEREVGELRYSTYTWLITCAGEITSAGEVEVG